MKRLIRSWLNRYLINQSGLFDPEFYVHQYPDVQMADVEPLGHYLEYGWKEGRNPSASFNTLMYLMNNQDVAKSGMNPLLHYIKFGKKEGRLVGSRFSFNQSSFWREGNRTEKSMVSVVVLVTRQTKNLIASIESILDQRYRDFEILLICEDSLKETLDIVNYYAKKYINIRVFLFRSNDEIPARRLNKGIREAKGEFIAFHDADAVAHPDRLTDSLKVINEKKVDVVFGGWNKIRSDRKIIEKPIMPELLSTNVEFQWLKEYGISCLSTVLVRTEVLRKVGGFKINMHQEWDYELWLRTAHQGYRFAAFSGLLTERKESINSLVISDQKTTEYWKASALKKYREEIELEAKVGYILPGGGSSGGALVVCEHANRLIKRGHDVDIILIDDSEKLDWFPGLMANVYAISSISNNYDILVATHWTTAIPVLKMNASRKVYLVQANESQFYKPGEENALSAVKTYEENFEFITIAHWIKDWLKEKFNQDSLFISNAVNKEVIHQVEAIENKGDKLRVLIEGSIDMPHKGVADAFSAVDGLDCEVWCVSNNGIPKTGWQYDRFFLNVPLDEMKRIYSSCDVLLKMSRAEGCFLPPLEMMACGGTAVLGWVTGIEEYVVHEDNALVVEQGDIQGARKALQRLIDDRNLLNRLKENGKRTARESNWDDTIDRLEEFFFNNEQVSK